MGLEPYRAPTISPRGWRVCANIHTMELADGSGACGLDADVIVSQTVDMDLAIGAGDGLDAQVTIADHADVSIDMLPAAATGIGLDAALSVNQTIAMDLATGDGAALEPILTIINPISDDFANFNNWTNRHNTIDVSGGAAYPVTNNAVSYATHNTAMSNNDMQVDIVIGTIPYNIGAPVYIVLGANTSGQTTVMQYTPSGYGGATAKIFTKPDWATAATERDASTSVFDFEPADKLSFRRVGNVYTGLKNDIAISGLSWTDSGDLHPRDSNHLLVGIGAYRAYEYGGPGIDGYVTIDSFYAA